MYQLIKTRCSHELSTSSFAANRSASCIGRQFTISRCHFTDDASKAATNDGMTKSKANDEQQQKLPQPKQSRKTQAQLDEELRQKLSELAGDGGEAGVEYEDGKPVAMKRGVKDNMFRYI